MSRRVSWLLIGYPWPGNCSNRTCGRKATWGIILPELRRGTGDDKREYRDQLRREKTEYLLQKVPIPARRRGISPLLIISSPSHTSQASTILLTLSLVYSIGWMRSCRVMIEENESDTKDQQAQSLHLDL